MFKRTFFISFIVLAASHAKALTISDVNDFLDNPDVVAYLGTHYDDKKAIKDGLRDFNRSVRALREAYIAYKSAWRSYNYGDDTFGIKGGYVERTGGEVDSAKENVRRDWEYVEARYHDIRQGMASHQNDANSPPAPQPTPNVTANTNSSYTWPDGRVLAQPDHTITTGVVKVRPNDTLVLRSGPGTGFSSVAQIPPNATDLLAFGQDQVWDGDTYWVPIQWQGLRGYVGRSKLPKAH